MTEKELLSAFEKNGVRKIDPIGEKFDYNFHQAMFEVETDKEEPGLVMQVLQPGYAIEDRVLRAAMVGVSKLTHQISPRVLMRRFEDKKRLYGESCAIVFFGQ